MKPLSVALALLLACALAPDVMRGGSSTAA
jgi:hypothetical protein